MIEIQTITKSEAYNILLIRNMSININDIENYARVDYTLKNNTNNLLFNDVMYFTKSELDTWGENDEVVINIILNKLQISNV